MGYIFSFFLLLLLPLTSHARPIAYGGGGMVMQEHNFDTNKLEINYSPKVSYSLGSRSEWNRDKKFLFNAFQFNYLINRFNFPEAQGNMYILSAVGVANKQSEVRPGVYIGFTGDFETRRIYTLYENYLFSAGSIDKSFKQKARFGVAPYIAGYKDLNTWFIIQVDHVPEGRKKVIPTPLVRFYKDAWLAEFGYSVNTKTLMFNVDFTY